VTFSRAGSQPTSSGPGGRAVTIAACRRVISFMILAGAVMIVRWLDDASAELGLLPPGEKAAVLKVAETLEAAGDMLGYPHSSAARGKGSTLRELRPRQGRSAARALYRRIGEEFVIGAVARSHEDKRPYNAVLAVARWRLDEEQRRLEKEGNSKR
jgi:hypothetical protein